MNRNQIQVVGACQVASLLILKMCFGQHFDKCVTLGKMGHTLKNVSHLEKCVTLRKMGHTLKNGSHLEKCVTLGKMGHFEK